MGKHYKSPQTDPSDNAPTKTFDYSLNEIQPRQSTAPPQFAVPPLATASCSHANVQIPAPAAPAHPV